MQSAPRPIIAPRVKAPSGLLEVRRAECLHCGPRRFAALRCTGVSGSSRHPGCCGGTPPGPPRCIATGVRRLEGAQAPSSTPRLTLRQEGIRPPHPQAGNQGERVMWLSVGPDGRAGRVAAADAPHESGLPSERSCQPASYSVGFEHAETSGHSPTGCRAPQCPGIHPGSERRHRVDDDAPPALTPEPAGGSRGPRAEVGSRSGPGAPRGGAPHAGVPGNLLRR